MNRSIANGHTARLLLSAAVTMTWQFATLPSAPQYWRATPADSLPCLGMLVSSISKSPRRDADRERSCRQTSSACQVECVMKCCSLWY